MAEHRERKQFYALDGLRGVAAVVVVMWHAGSLFDELCPKSGYLAVDLFFGLSGFVICHAYGERLRQGLSAGRFLVLRLIRLYPLYILGICLAAAWDLGGMALGRDAHPLNWYVFSVAMAPSPPGPESELLYPLNPPAWSLLFEVVANCGLALAPALALRTCALTFIFVAAATCLAIQAIWLGDLHGGSMWPTAWGGLPRVATSFVVGILIYRLRPPAWFRAPPLLIVAITTALLFVDVPEHIRPIYDLGVVLLAWPAVLAASVNSEPAPAFRRVYGWLGDVSYAVYALHFPIIIAISGVLQAAAPTLLSEAGELVGFLCVGVSLAAAWVTDIVYDQPVRRRLTRWFDARRLASA